MAETAQPTPTHATPEQQALLQWLVQKLNTEFQEWVAIANADELWIAGARNYLRHANTLTTLHGAAERDPSAAAPPANSNQSVNGNEDEEEGQPSPSLRSAERQAVLLLSVRALNNDFRSWIARENINELWVAAVRHYLRLAGEMRATLFGAAERDAPTAAPPTDSRQSVNGGAAPINAPSATDTRQEEEEEPELSSSSVDETGADEEEVTHSVRCRIYAMVDGAWKDIGGMGQLSLRKLEDTELSEERPRFVFHNHVGEVLLDAAVYTGMKLQVNNSSLVTHLFTAAAQIDTMVAIKTNGPEDAEFLAIKINEIMPSASATDVEQEVAVERQPAAVVQAAGYTLGGIQGLSWYLNSKLRKDEDGDVATSFWCERAGGSLPAELWAAAARSSAILWLDRGNVYPVGMPEE
eukprot:jgi/Chlat1/769/Chrsp104S00028